MDAREKKVPYKELPRIWKGGRWEGNLNSQGRGYSPRRRASATEKGTAKGGEGEDKVEEKEKHAKRPERQKSTRKSGLTHY